MCAVGAGGREVSSLPLSPEKQECRFGVDMNTNRYLLLRTEWYTIPMAKEELFARRVSVSRNLTERRVLQGLVR